MIIMIVYLKESNKGKPVFETGPHKLLWKVRPPLYVAYNMYSNDCITRRVQQGQACLRDWPTQTAVESPPSPVCGLQYV